MSEYSFQPNTSKKPNFSTLLLADLFNFCFFILSHPLYLSYFIFFSPYLLKLLSFLSPLFITTSLLVLAYLTFSPTLVHDNVANSELSEIKPGFLVTTYQTVLERLQKSKVLDHTDGDHGGDDHEEFRSFVELEAYKIVFDTSSFDIGENPVEENCSQVFEAPVEENCSQVFEAPAEEKCSQVFDPPVEENCSLVFEAQVEAVVSGDEVNVLDNSALFEAANDVFDENPVEVAWPGVETLIEHWSKNIVGTKAGKEVKKLSSQPNKVEEDGKAKWSIKRASKDLKEFNIPSQNQLTTEKVTHSVTSQVHVSEFVPPQDQLTTGEVTQSVTSHVQVCEFVPPQEQLAIGEVTQLVTSHVKVSEFVPSQDLLTFGEVTPLVTSPVKISEFSDATPVKLSEFFDAGQFFASCQNLSSKPSVGEIPKRRGDKFGSQDINGELTGQNCDLGSFGSMRKEKEWRRTLACKLFEERHQNVDCGGEGMDMLWETYDDQTESIKVMKGKSNAKKGKNGKVENYNEEYEDEEEELDNGQLCCLQALKFSAGKMNMGMGRPNLVKFSKALKGFGWLHHVTKHGKKGYH